MDNSNQMQKRAIAYSFLAHIKTNGTFIKGPLDVFVPIVKYALSELYPEGTASGAHISEVSDSINDRFGIYIPIPVMRNILTKIAHELNSLFDSSDMLLYGDDSFVIKQFAFEGYSELIEKCRDDVRKVLVFFKNFCAMSNINSDCDEASLIKFIDQNRSDISYYLSHADKIESNKDVAAAQFVDYFKQTPSVFDVLKSIYLGSMLTSYLSYEPSNVKMDVEVLLDTNFIVSLLDLNTPESTKSCNAFIQAGKRLGYTFSVLIDTIEEFKYLLSHKSSTLNSAIIAKSINREDIYNACDRRKLTSVDLDRISDNIETTLSKFGFRIIYKTDKYQNLAKFSVEYELLKQYRSSEKAALHDAMAIQYVREKRGKRICEFDKVNCWFVNNAITHSDENNNVADRLLEGDMYQPEIIKVDDLLNIIWLSNPTASINDSDIVDMGLASMVSYTLSSTLPKSRIIRELDENIQKYRSDYNITDKDVLNLSTRIVNRQISDVQAFNELAKNDTAQFAARVKEEAMIQESNEQARAQKFEKLLGDVYRSIDELRQNKETQAIKHSEKMKELEAEKCALETIRKEMSIKERDLNKKEKSLSAVISQKDDTLKNLWKKENQSRSEQREKLKDLAVESGLRHSKRNLIGSVISFIVIVSIILSLYVFLPDTLIAAINELFNFKLISAIFSIITGLAVAVGNVFCILNYYNWHHNPGFRNSVRDEVKIPDELMDITFEDYINSAGH